MNTIVLQPDGTLACRQCPISEDPLSFLGSRLSLAEACTLRSFFRMLDKYADLSRLNPFCSSFLSNYKTCPQDECLCGHIDRLELTRTVEMIGYPGEPSVQMFVSLQGWSGADVCDIKSFWLDHLLDVKLRMGRLQHCIFGDKVDTFEFETGFNLFEFIDGVCWQLSFHNLPEQCRIFDHGA